MDDETIETLLALNRRFYTDLAAPFAASRPAGDPVLAPILPHIPERARVLDVGCGNGRLALLLAHERPGTHYVGVDASPDLIAAAQREAGRLEGHSTTFCVADIARPGWTSVLPVGDFDYAIALAVLHHIPSFELRARVLNDIGTVLAPAGRLILTTWQFLAHARMRLKIVPWTEAGLAEEQLEPGDYLLDWKRGGRGLRYCHLVDEAEVQRLAAAAGFRVLETFRAGGREGDLSLGAVLG
jgi:tRNA (uracil-5-)-methyltransferase TRM9